VADDRRLVLDEMQAWNQRNAKDRGCFLTALTWEDLVSPDISDTAQDVINVEVGDDYDVFLGLMWGRFGSPTKKAESGTKEEFDRALNRKFSGEALRISFFFRKSDLPIDQIDPDQFARVKKFQSELSDKGAYYGQYSDDRELASALTTLFDRIASEKDRYLGDTEAPSQSAARLADSQVRKQNEENTEEHDPDAGLFDLEDDLTKHTDSFAAGLGEWGDQFRVLNDIVEQTTSNMNSLSQFGQPDRDAIRSEVEVVTSGLRDFANFAKDKITVIEDDLEGMYRAMNGIVIVSRSFDLEQIEINSLLEQMSGLRDNVEQSDALLSQYIEVMEGLPRIEKGFNRARATVVVIHKQLRKKLRDFKDRLDKICDELQKG
jgi:hypothetical protein